MATWVPVRVDDVTTIVEAEDESVLGYDIYHLAVEGWLLVMLYKKVIHAKFKLCPRDSARSETISLA